MTSKHKGTWPYHEDPHGNWRPCNSNPCKLHSGGDIMATSPEDAMAKAHAGDGGAAGMSAPARKPPVKHNVVSEVEELDARFDSRKSFYGKAHTMRMTDGALALQSYDTTVAVIRDGKLKVRGKYSQTTSRHVREFARQYLDSFHDEDLKKYDDDDPVFEKSLLLP